MTAKTTGLSAFTRKKPAAPAPAPAAAATTPEPAPSTGTGRKRAQGATVALTVRIPRSDWARLHQLAVAEGTSLQTLALAGLSKVFADHGLPPIE
jgi:hypothetical protein